MNTVEKSVHILLNYGWSDKTIAHYLMIKEYLVRNYRKRFGIARNLYQEFY